MGLLDYLNYARAAGSGLLGGAVGWPMDTAVNLGNLAKAGYGYGGKTLGLLGTQDLPEITDPATVPGTSAYISKLLGVGDSTGEQVAEFAGSLLSPGPKAKPPKTLKAIVYHGSPHKFDKFDASKIGTGEGAQAYGHGLYLAESPDVARQYQNMSPRKFIHDGKEVDIDWSNPIHVAIRNADLAGGREAGIARLTETIQAKTADKSNKEVARKAIAFLRSGESFDKYATTGGQLYKVDLPDEWLPKMLDWDKPLSQQPEAVRKALDAATDKLGFSRVADLRTHPVLSVKPGTDALREAGIPGIRYKDQGSRGKEGGTHNYVVFPGMEHLLKILSRE